MATEQLIDEQVIEEVAETARRLTSREAGFFAAGAGIGFAAGFTIGYLVMERRVKKVYDKVVEDEIKQLREHYHAKEMALEVKASRQRPLDEIVLERGYAEDDQSRYTPEELEAIREANRAAAAEEAAEAEKAAMVASNPPIVEEEDDWDYEIEILQRDPEVPYIIHYDEFRENDPDNDQSTYTYYEVDDILADARDIPVDDMDALIGLGNLGKWGHGSNDPNVVYIRNEHLGLDVEVVRDRGSFAEQTGRHLRHSSDRRRRPTRRFDDDD